MDQTNQTQVSSNPPAPEVYGGDSLANEKKNVSIKQLLLDEYFKDHDTVRVMNILDKPFYWQAIDPEDEVIQIEGDQFSQRKITHRKPPKMFVIMPKATKRLTGWNASMMINKMVKQIRVEQALRRKEAMPGVKIMSADWYDYRENKKLIDQIFLGKENNAVDEPVAAAIQQVNEAPEAPINNYKSVDDLAKEFGIEINDGNSKDS